ncbi:hypothetical protein VTP01DRAFT_7836 [Rhizomucor pusillus]|uniref:uncharacterized protein n=1 Tax=Rhizomucor pusillus TaxID=4840 RepID=UPI0037440CF1
MDWKRCPETGVDQGIIFGYGNAESFRVQCKRYKVLPVLLTVCTEKLSPCRLMDSFTVCCDKPFVRQSPSNFWAQHCFLLSRSTIEHFADADGDLDLLVALIMFLTYGMTRLL